MKKKKEKLDYERIARLLGADMTGEKVPKHVLENPLLLAEWKRRRDERVRRERERPRP